MRTVAASEPGEAGEDRSGRIRETIRKISRAELLRFKIGLDGLAERPSRRGDGAIAVVSGQEKNSWMKFQFINSMWHTRPERGAGSSVSGAKNPWPASVHLWPRVIRIVPRFS